MSTSSSIPILSDVLFYTANDPYSLEVDNRPIYNIDSNIRHINTSLVGVGYGEHASVDGTKLSVGRAVELLETGAVKYPDNSTAIKTSPVIGLVTGSTESGLCRVIWYSGHLDLESIGTGGILSVLASAAEGSYILASTDGTGTISFGVSIATGTLALGRVKSYPYVSVSVSKDDVNATAVNASAKVNSHNLYGFTRLRNLLTMVDIGQTPIQYQKKTYYQSNLPSIINPMSAVLSASLDSISALDPTSVNYGPEMTNKVIKERYTRLVTAGGSDVVSNSGWSDKAYSRKISDGISEYENYDLASISLTPTIKTPNYSSNQSNLNTFKEFTIEKYYQYAKISAGDVLSGKVMVTATVFNPLKITNHGGEYGQTIIWDFYEYDAITGLEITKNRVITTDSSNVFTSDIFPSELVALV